MDGPFTEGKELIAGYWIIQVESREEAKGAFQEKTKQVSIS